MGNKRETKAESLVIAIRRQILAGEIRAGTSLKQDELAVRFGSSSTPVREALSRLESEGLVEHEPYRGMRVVAYRLSEVREYFALRSLLEPYALQTAMEIQPEVTMVRLRTNISLAYEALGSSNMDNLSRINWSFHELLAELPNSLLLRKTLEGVWRAFRLDTLLMIPERAGKTVEEHDNIVKALERDDIVTAIHLLKEHISKARDAVLHRLAQFGLPSG